MRYFSVSVLRDMYQGEERAPHTRGATIKFCFSVGLKTNQAGSERGNRGTRAKAYQHFAASAKKNKRTMGRMIKRKGIGGMEAAKRVPNVPCRVGVLWGGGGGGSCARAKLVLWQYHLGKKGVAVRVPQGDGHEKQGTGTQQQRKAYNIYSRTW